ncbi:MAG: hypothetical protein RML12_00090 [Xanthomonadales bacterium]|nr:hypothetical protein [Xanthomonadales bacterium]
MRIALAAVNRALRALADALLGRLLPRRCLLCGAPGEAGLDLCRRLRRRAALERLLLRALRDPAARPGRALRALPATAPALGGGGGTAALRLPGGPPRGPLQVPRRARGRGAARRALAARRGGTRSRAARAARAGAALAAAAPRAGLQPGARARASDRARPRHPGGAAPARADPRHPAAERPRPPLAGHATSGAPSGSGQGARGARVGSR